MGIPLVELSGSYEEVGGQHGRLLGTEIQEALDSWGAPDRWVAGLLAATDYRSAMAEHVPELLIELDAIAEAAGIDHDRLFAFNLLDEGWWYSREGVPPGCSVVWRPGVLSQNMDLEPWTEGHQVVLSIEPDRGPSLQVLSLPGFLGLTGLNEAGVAVCVTNLAMLRHQAVGVPVAAVIRGILSTTTVESAVDFVRGVPHAAAQTYVIAGPSTVAALEASASGVAETPVVNEWWCHTNHPLASADLEPTIDADSLDAAIKSSERLAILKGHRDEVPALRAVAFPRMGAVLITFATVRYQMAEGTAEFLRMDAPVTRADRPTPRLLLRRRRPPTPTRWGRRR